MPLRRCPFNEEDLDEAPCCTAHQQAVQQSWVSDTGEDGRVESKIVPGQVSASVGQLLVENNLTNADGTPVSKTSGKGTAFIIRRKGFEALMTCAHNVVNRCPLTNKMFTIKSGDFYKARRGQSNHCILHLSGDPIYHEKYDPSNKLGGYDIAIVNFEKSEYYVKTRRNVDCPIGIATSLAIYTPKLTVMGYPGDQRRLQGYQRTMSHIIGATNIEDGGVIIKYKIDTTEGQSGSPVIATIEGKQYLVGVHNGNLSTHKLNFGTGFSEETIKWIDATMDKLRKQTGELSPDVVDTLPAPIASGKADGSSVDHVTTHLRDVNITPAVPANVVVKSSVASSSTPVSASASANGSCEEAISLAPQMVSGEGNLKCEAVNVTRARPRGSLSPPAQYSMSEEHRDNLRRLAPYLSSNLTIDITLLNELVSNNCITEPQREEIEVKPTKPAKINELRTLLSRRGPDAMAKFVDALMRTDQGHVALTLAPDLAWNWKK